MADVALKVAAGAFELAAVASELSLAEFEVAVVEIEMAAAVFEVAVAALEQNAVIFDGFLAAEIAAFEIAAYYFLAAVGAAVALASSVKMIETIFLVNHFVCYLRDLLYPEVAKITMETWYAGNPLGPEFPHQG
jgi:hypothetical protein